MSLVFNTPSSLKYGNVCLKIKLIKLGYQFFFFYISVKVALEVCRKIEEKENNVEVIFLCPVPRSRSSVQIKVNYQGHIFKNRTLKKTIGHDF